MDLIISMYCQNKQKLIFWLCVIDESGVRLAVYMLVSYVININRRICNK